MPAVLVTLGRLPKGLDLIRSFHALGWRVIVADPYRNHLSRISHAVTKSHCVPAPVRAPDEFLNALKAIIADEDIDLVLPVSEEILYVSALHTGLPTHVRLLSMPHDLIRHVHDKYEFIMLAREIGLSVPDTALIAHKQALEIANRQDYIVKPRHSCAGFDVSFHSRQTALPDQENAIVQSAIEGTEASTCGFAHHGNLLGQAIYRATLQSGTVAIGFERIEHAAIDEWVTRFVAATHWSGFIAFDFILDRNDVPYAIECNPRTTSGLHFFETRDLAKALLDPTSPMRFRRQRQLIQFWSVMQHFVDHLGDAREMARAIHHIFRRRDVTFSWRDPLPFLLMPWMAQEIMQAAKREKIPFGIAATRDFVFPPEK